MQAKVFDPFTEAAVNDWLATTPANVIYSANVFDTTPGGQTRQVALVFYQEEHELGAPVPVEAPEDAFARLLERRGSDWASV